MAQNNIHDKAYKYLFSNPLIVKELLESFVAMDWIKQVNFNKAQPIDKSYVNDDYKEYEADIIYKLYFKDRQLYLYLLIEFQSTVDRFISFRMLNYVMELYRELIYKQKLKKLPVVFPILIYNGDRKWTAPQSLQELIDMPESLKQCTAYIPQFQYYPIIENELSRKTLESMMNVISTVFLFETGDPMVFLKTVDRIKELLHIYNDEPLMLRTLFYWLMHYLQTHGKIDDAAVILETIEEPEEVHSMLSKTIQKMQEDFRKEGFHEGIHIGIDKGIQKGINEGISIERRNIAINMLKKGIDKKTIIEITKLNKKQLADIEKGMQ
ncbi:MAG TPA: Rpn family recombination-promoting nuclease/putative transposase [Spirochaetota bacterium]|mgnify:CR=1 FL=1|nr:Rpn family recombination-promoting nuclease/putative transposase [Spirochaetota bacterium]